MEPITITVICFLASGAGGFGIYKWRIARQQTYEEAKQWEDLWPPAEIN